MGEVQLYQRTQLPPDRGPNALPPYYLADKSSQIRTGRIIAGIGEDWMNKLRQAQFDTDMSDFRVTMQNQMADYEKWQNDNPDAAYDEMQNATEYNRRFGPDAKAAILKSLKTKEARLKAGLQYNEQVAGNKEWAQKNAGAIVAKLNVDSLNNKVDLAVSINDPDMLIDELDKGVQNGTILKGIAEIKLREGMDKIDTQLTELYQQIHKAGVSEVLMEAQTTIEDAVAAGGDVAKAKKQVQNMLVEKKKQGILTAEDVQTLTGNLNSYTEGKIRETTLKGYNLDLELTADFIKKIQKGELTPDDILSSGISKGMMKFWYYGYKTGEKDKEGKDIEVSGISDVMYDAPPKTTTGAGFDVAKDAVFDITGKKKDKLKALEELLTARYIDKTLNDEDFNWAIERIQNPYPRHVTDMLKNELAAAQTDITIAANKGWWWSMESKNVAIKAKTAEVGKQLIHWVEDELAYNPKKIFTPKEIFAMKSELGVAYKEPAVIPPKDKSEADVRMQSAPAMELDPYWDKLDKKQKRLVWQAFENGVPVDEILGAKEFEGLR